MTSHTHRTNTSHLSLLNFTALVIFGNSTYNHTSQGSRYVHTVEIGYYEPRLAQHLGYNVIHSVVSNNSP
jgi:hypothetical protein